MQIVKNNTSAEPLKKEKQTVSSMAEKKKPVEQPTSDGAALTETSPGTSIIVKYFLILFSSFLMFVYVVFFYYGHVTFARDRG